MLDALSAFPVTWSFTALMYLELLHFPPSLQRYLDSGVRPHRPFILILTKCDLVTTDIVQGWVDYFEKQSYTIVTTQNYLDSQRSANEQGTRAKFVPGQQSHERQALLDSIAKLHSKLCQPPLRIQDDPEKLAKWKPRVKADIDWSALEQLAEVEQDLQPAKELEAESKIDARKQRKWARQEHLKSTADKQANTVEDSSDGSSDEAEVEPLPDYSKPHFSIGLIGAPNVGKSSLLNALLRRKVVRASKTPGKTKHLQTIFMTQDVRLIDCPGLVCPSYAGMRMQVLAGMIPIQAAEYVIHWIAQRMPLEQILGLPGDRQWTTDAILTEYALRNGFLTAKAGRPDTARAGSHILRQIHSKIPWAFRSPSSSVQDDIVSGLLLDMAHFVEGGEDFADEQVDTRSSNDEGYSSTNTEEEEEEGEDQPVSLSSSIFGSLIIDDQDSE